MYSFLDLPRNYIAKFYPTVFRNFILFTIAIFDRPFVFIAILKIVRFTEIDCFGVTVISYINNVAFIFCNFSHSIFRLATHLAQSVIFFVSSEYTSLFLTITLNLRWIYIHLISVFLNICGLSWLLWLRPTVIVSNSLKRIY